MSDAVISGVGLCCSLGRSFEAATKAYAAGDINFEKTDRLVGPDGLPLRIAPVFAYHDIHNYEIRLQRLASAAFEDLAAQIGARTRPAPLRLVVPAWLVESDIGQRLSKWIRESHANSVSSVELLASQNTLALTELAGALLAINEDEADVLLAGAIDSFMQAELIDALALGDRLLCRGQPHGVVPSEACVLFRLCAAGESVQGAPGGTVEAVWTGREAENPAAPNGILGRGLAQPFHAALAERVPDRLMIDLNGERWRAEEAGFALSGAQGLPDDVAADFETPPLYSGFCGCATGAVMAALALADGPLRGTDDGTVAVSAPGGREERTIICNSQYDGLRAAALIGRFAADAAGQEEAA